MEELSLDGGHCTALVGREPVAPHGAERVAVAMEDVRHLKRGAHGAALFGRDDLERKRLEWTRCTGDQAIATWA
jgi:hypothetical protein